ncbi:MAG: CoA transferase [Alphaproteobacteria bacterium]|nr:MAG: CoA transferase [Alphaproteobacteria bacterium]
MIQSPPLGRKSGHADDPLSDIRVVDFTIIMSGPLCTRALADAGADVIKIEAPQGDAIRHRAPNRSGISTYFASLNCGKRSIILDLKSDQGCKIAERLIETADVVVENFRPGVMKRLGLDFERMKAKNPGLIYCSISGAGQTGPSATAPAYAPVIHASSGLELANQQYQRGSDRPANNGIFIADVLGATHAVSAIQLALYDRERTGEGQHIDVALMDSILGMLIYELLTAQFPSDRPRQVYEPVKAKDGYVMVAAVTPRNLEVLFRVIGFPGGHKDPRFATVAAKEENWSALLKIIEDWTSRHSAAECQRILLEAGVPCSRYRTVQEAMEDPQIQERGLMARLGNEMEPFLVANQPYKFSRSHVAARSRLPGLGEHTEEVLMEALGLERHEIATLEKDGAFGKTG